MHPNSLPIYALFYLATLTPTLSSPLPPSTPLAPHPLQKRGPPECRARYGGLRYNECAAAVAQIDDAPFVYDPGNDLNGLPLIWSVGECTVMAGPVSPDQRIRVGFGDIEAAARDILGGCVARYGWGGQALTGPSELFQVIMYQFSYSDDSDDGEGPNSSGECSIKGGYAAHHAPGSCVLNSAINSGFIGSSP